MGMESDPRTGMGTGMGIGKRDGYGDGYGDPRPIPAPLPFLPKSRIADFDKGVFKGILGNNKTSGPILIYPMNKNKWDQRSSVVTPDEDVFYLVALLRSALDDGGDETRTLDYLTNQNRQILRFCRDEGIKVKQYLPHHTTQQEWRDHFGDKWALFHQRKMEFDPRRILATGQRIFEPSFTTTSTTTSSKMASW